MKERPIPFSAPMVRATLSAIDTKTQTRRVVKPVGDDGGFVLQDYGDGLWPYRSDDGESTMKNGMEIPHACPYGQPGDRLWVREAYRFDRDFDGIKPSVVGPGQPVWHEAQDDVPCHPTVFGKLRPGMFMPRWASRITLEITGVRVERLQDISEEDAIAEGIEKAYVDAAGRQRWRMYDHQDGVPGEDVATYAGPSHTSKPIESFKSLWLSINGPGSWDANPWVWAVEFRRLP